MLLLAEEDGSEYGGACSSAASSISSDGEDDKDVVVECGQRLGRWKRFEEELEAKEKEEEERAIAAGTNMPGAPTSQASKLQVRGAALSCGPAGGGSMLLIRVCPGPCVAAVLLNVNVALRSMHRGAPHAGTIHELLDMVVLRCPCISVLQTLYR